MTTQSWDIRNEEPGPGKPRLLLIEDNALIQAELVAALQDRFDIVGVIATAREAVAWLQSNPDGWELAVVDLFLKSGNGFQVLRHCADARPGQTVVVLSNYTREPARSSALERGADAVFDKSFEMQEFLAYCAARAHVPQRASRPHTLVPA